MQQVIDLYNVPITVTNLDKAISQAEEFSRYELTGSEWEGLQAERKAYWADLLDKLLQLKSNLPDSE